MITTVVLDLDETVIRRALIQDESDFAMVIASDETHFAYFQIRPHFHSFVSWCYERDIDIVIFTAGNQSYANIVTDNLFEKYKRKPMAILHNGHMTKLKRSLKASGEIETKELETVSKVIQRPVEHIVGIDDYVLNFLYDEPMIYRIEPFVKSETDIHMLKAIQFIENLLIKKT